MKLEVGKRYVLRNGSITGPLRKYDWGEYVWVAYVGKDAKDRTWTADGVWFPGTNLQGHDIVAEYIEPPEPLRWVENCKPDKPGIWACLHENKRVTVYAVHSDELRNQWRENARCYLGPIPEILPPVKKVVQRLWIRRTGTFNSIGYEEGWFADGETIQPPGDWIRTDRTREVEQ